jgi:hypothetical protein
VKPTDKSNLSSDQVGALLVSVLALGMVVAPGVSWLLDYRLSSSGLVARCGVAAVATILAWSPLPLPAGWRRMLAVSLLAAHHVGVGVAVGMPMTLFVELLLGSLFVGGLGCWLLPRSGFGLLLSVTLSVGTLALGMLPPASDPSRLWVWASLFLLAGLAAELSLWVGPRVAPPGAPEATRGAWSQRRTARGAVLSLAEEVGLGVATCRNTPPQLAGASRSLVEMTAEWSSPADWWNQLVERDRVPEPGTGPVSIEMFTPGMRTRRAFRLWAIEQGGRRHIVVRDTTDVIQARREAERLTQSLDAARGEAASAREARVQAFRSRSHHLRTPLSNLMASLELAMLSVDERASRSIIREDLQAAAGSAEVLHKELNRLVEEIISDSQDAPGEEVFDLIGIVDRELDGLQAARSVRRSYAVAVLPVRGPRDELVSLVQAVVRRSVVASRGTVFVRVEALETGESRVVFRVSDADASLIYAAIRELSPRAAGLGGRIDLTDPLGPALVLPEDSSDRPSIESGLTWVGALPPLDAPDGVHRGAFDTELLDDEPTHIAYARRQAMEGDIPSWGRTKG